MTPLFERQPGTVFVADFVADWYKFVEELLQRWIAHRPVDVFAQRGNACFASGVVLARTEVFDLRFFGKVVAMCEAGRHPNPFSMIHVRIRRHVIRNQFAERG